MIITNPKESARNKLKTLEYILCNNPNGINLLDNCLFSGDHKIFSTLTNLSTGSFLGYNRVSLYKNYISKLFECINLHDENVTIPEIIDSEMFNLRKKFKNKRRNLKDSLSLKERELLSFERVLRDLDEIDIVFEALTEVLSNNENYKFFIQGNQFDCEIYQKYEILINGLFNNFSGKYVKQESICADDGLIAASIILLKRLKKPINIISGDLGVLRRIKIFNTFTSQSRKHNHFYKKMHGLLMSLGISIYSNLYSGEMYRFFGSTNDNRLWYNLNRNNKVTDFFYKITDEISSLEKKYDMLFLRNVV